MTPVLQLCGVNWEGAASVQEELSLFLASDRRPGGFSRHGVEAQSNRLSHIKRPPAAALRRGRIQPGLRPAFAYVSGGCSFSEARQRLVRSLPACSVREAL